MLNGLINHFEHIFSDTRDFVVFRISLKSLVVSIFSFKNLLSSQVFREPVFLEADTIFNNSFSV
jgi:hypothetical protein